MEKPVSKPKVIRLSTLLDYGGIESKMVKLSQSQNPEIEWVFFAIGNGGWASGTILKQNKRVEVLRLRYRIPSFIAFYKLYLLFKKEKPHVVHASGAEANFHGVVAAKLAGVPKIVCEEIGIPKHSSLARFIFKRIFNLSDVVVSESNLVRNFLRENYFLSDDRLKVVPNFIVLKDFEPRKSRNNNRFSLVTVSRLEAVKNIEGIVRVISKLKSENYSLSLTIIGDGSEKEKLQNLSRKLGLENEVVFAGFQPNPTEYFQESDAFVLNSHTEGFSNAILEAMLAGLPVVATNVGAAPEMIINGINGWLVNASDDNSLYQQLKKVIGLDYTIRENVGRNGFQTVVENYSLEQHESHLLKIYES